MRATTPAVLLPALPPRPKLSLTPIGETLKVSLTPEVSGLKVSRRFRFQAREGSVCACTPSLLKVSFPAPFDAGQIPPPLPSSERKREPEAGLQILARPTVHPESAVAKMIATSDSLAVNRARDTNKEVPMSAACAVEPRNDVERLFREMIASGSVALSVTPGDGFFWVHLGSAGQVSTTCDCHADLWATRTPHWALYARLGAARLVRFVREPDPHAPHRESLSIRFVGPEGGAIVRGSFAPLYDDQGRPVAAQFARWEALRAKYGGQDELRVQDGAMLPSG